MRAFVLVYQAGIANVFATDVDVWANDDWLLCSKRFASDWRLQTQTSFDAGALLARGARMAGAAVRTVSCNCAGDCRNVNWTAGVDGTPFRDSAAVIESRGDQ